MSAHILYLNHFKIHFHIGKIGLQIETIRNRNFPGKAYLYFYEEKVC